MTKRLSSSSQREAEKPQLANPDVHPSTYQSDIVAPRAGVTRILTLVSTELKAHAPFTMLGTLTGVVIMVAIVALGVPRTIFHRLNVFTILLPALRERSDDIPDLVDYFLHRFAGELRIDKPLLSEEAMEVLRTYSWPGNVRELEHCIQRLMISTGGHPIQAVDLSSLLAHADQLAACGLRAADDEVLRDLIRRYLSSAVGDLAHERFLQKVETFLITEALRRTKGNQTHAARLLGLPRQTLYDKLQKYRLLREGGALED